MASNNYSTYNYQDYQQSASQPYSGYQTAPNASTIAQNQRQQYQQAAPAAASQSTSYMPSYTSQSYGNQSNVYGTAQDPSWGANYGGTRETTRGAAEALRNLSSTPYTPNTTAAANQPGYTATNTATTRYSTTPAAQPSQPQTTHTSHTYTQAQPQAQSQARPRSVNANPVQTGSTTRALPSPAVAAEYPSQRAQNIYNQQPQRSESPAQPQYNRSTPTSATSAATAAGTSTSQYSGYRHRQLPSVEAPRNAQTSTVSTSYNYTDGQTAATAQIPTPANNSDGYNQGAITVDPMAVYNPHSEYQRQLEKMREQKAVEDAVRAEEERKAEEIRLEAERKKEEERKKEDERKKADEERARQAAVAHSQTPQSGQKQPGEGRNGPTASGEQGSSDNLESEIRAMMAKMRELNGKDPALLARIWEEERRAKVPKSPATQSKLPAPSAATQPTQSTSQPKQTTKSRKKAPPATSAPQAHTPVTTQATAPQLPPQAVVTGPARPAGNTIWPPEKKSQLAIAATAYLNGQNPSNPVLPDTILSMLDGNPSYIELCEILESKSLNLDRAAFAKSLLTAVPDVNSASRSQTQGQPRTSVQPANGANAPRVQAPPAIMVNKNIATPMSAAPSPQYSPAAQSPLSRSYPPFPDNQNPASQPPVPVAQMIPIKPELKPPANKEEAARKRNFNDLIDLTAHSENEDMVPMPKRQNLGSIYSYDSPTPVLEDSMDVDGASTPTSNFPVAASLPPQPSHPASTTDTHRPQSLHVQDLRTRNLVQALDKKKALRRSGYNIKTIARDVLLACGRHPDERQLNGHLEVLKINLSPQVTNEVDLSTLRWDLIDPGQPPKGYYRDKMQAVAEDADDEDESEDEVENARARAPSQASGSGVTPAAASAAQASALPPTNPFKPHKRRGRPPRHSYPDTGPVHTPVRSTTSTGTSMSSSAPRPPSSAGSVGYSAFRAATQYGPDGQPLPKKKGRPVGWRKHIHGSAAAQARPGANGHTGLVADQNRFAPSQPSALRNVRTGNGDTIMVDSSSPSAPSRAPRYQSFKCRWQNCKADLHNLETLKKHVQKVHCKQTLRRTFECLWHNCGSEVTKADPATGTTEERHQPFSFAEERQWREHLEIRHFGPLSWELGDGPASGLSDANEAEDYLSDTQGRRVTPRIPVEPSWFAGSSPTGKTNPSSAPRGRGRPPKEHQDAREAQDRLVAHKKRLGGPGIDRGGSTLVNEKRMKGFSDDDQTEEEIVDAES